MRLPISLSLPPLVFLALSAKPSWLVDKAKYQLKTMGILFSPNYSRFTHRLLAKFHQVRDAMAQHGPMDPHIYGTAWHGKPWRSPAQARPGLLLTVFTAICSRQMITAKCFTAKYSLGKGGTHTPQLGQGFRMAWLIRRQKCPCNNPRLISSMLTF